MLAPHAGHRSGSRASSTARALAQADHGANERTNDAVDGLNPRHNGLHEVIETRRLSSCDHVVGAETSSAARIPWTMATSAETPLPAVPGSTWISTYASTIFLLSNPAETNPTVGLARRTQALSSAAT